MFSNIKIRARLIILLIAMTIPMVVVLLLGLRGMGIVYSGLKTVYEDRTVCLVQLNKVGDALYKIRISLIESAAHPSEGVADKLSKISDYRKIIDKEWSDYLSTYLTPDEKVIADRVNSELTAYLKDIDTSTAMLSANASDPKVMDYLLHTLQDAATQTMKDQADLVSLQERVAKEEFDRASEAFSMTRIENALIALVGFLLSLTLAMWIVRSITHPIDGMIDVMGLLAKGDTSVTITGQERADEIGGMARAVDIFKTNAIERGQLEEKEKENVKRRDARAQKVDHLTRDFDHRVGEVLETVASAANELDSTSAGMSDLASAASERATAVAAGAHQAAANVQTVAAAATELSASIVEISRQMVEATSVAGAASDESRRATSTMQGLADSATRIGEVVRLISDIASQTNLLALNATIEAARAGDAGKGFAVVASEVKTLANQTAKATEDITTQVQAVQNSSKEAVDVIEGISTIIGRIYEISTIIASSVEEQGAATQEIARNVEQAAYGTEEVTSNIAGVTQAAEETGEAASNVRNAAGELNVQSTLLKHLVQHFLDDVRAA